MASSESVSAAALPSGTKLGRADKTISGYDAAIGHMNKYLNELGFPEFKELKPQHVEGDNLQNILENIGVLFAAERIRTKQNTWMGTSTKKNRFKEMKQVLSLRFKNHEDFKSSGGEEWFKDMLERFVKQCESNSVEDPNVTEERKSEPLYSDLEVNLHFIRAKFMDLSPIDAKSVAMSMLRAGLFKDVKDFVEFVLSKNAVARGGEHRFLRWNEAAWDYFFNAPDFDWRIIKQRERQAMLLFCHRLLYCLCPFFAFALYFLFGGLRRNGDCDPVIADYVFPYLHSIRKDSAARRITTAIQSNIEDKTRAKAFTSRSTRKGAMTEMRMHPDLSTQEEYDRSGHTAPGMNSNAEGYIESTPAMNAPGGLCMSGYLDCHSRVYPYNLECLGMAVAEDGGPLSRFLDKLFFVDVPQLQIGGKLRPLLLTAAARLIGSYNQLVLDLGVDNNIVKRIMKAAHEAEIDDDAVPLAAKGPRWHAVLKYWSKTVQDDFDNKNPERVSTNSSTSQQLVSLGNIIGSFDKRLGAIEKAMTTNLTAIQLLTQNNELQKERIKELELENRRLKRQREKGSPAASQSDGVCRMQEQEQACGRNGDENGSAKIDAALSKATSHERNQIDVTASQEQLQQQEEEALDADVELSGVDGPQSKKARKSVNNSLDGVVNDDTGVGGITVADELERLWNAKEFERLKLLKTPDNTDKNGSVPRKYLFEEGPESVRMHPTFARVSEGARYRKAMTLVAMSVEKSEWDSLIDGSMDSKAHRDMFMQVQQSTMAKAVAIEVVLGIREAGKKCNANPTLHSLGTRYGKIMSKWKDTFTSEQITVMVAEKTGGKVQQKQSLLSNIFGVKKK